jgi:hypothetical protein
LNRGPFTQPALPGVVVTTGLSATPGARPVPRGHPVEGHAPSPLGVSRVALDLHLQTCRRQYPGGPLGSGRSWDSLFQLFPRHPQQHRPSLHKNKVGDHISLFEACSTFTRVTACLLAESPSDPFISKAPTDLLPPRVASIASGRSDPVAGRDLHPQKIRAFLHGALLCLAVVPARSPTSASTLPKARCARSATRGPGPPATYWVRS